MSALCLTHVFVGGVCSCGETMAAWSAKNAAATYTDDVIAVMRDTITSLREAIKAKDATIALLRHEVEQLRAACDLACARLEGSPLPEGM